MTDLQVAWEVLELAKRIFEKRKERGLQKLAQTYIVLGEVSMESENFEGNKLICNHLEIKNKTTS